MAASIESRAMTVSLAVGVGMLVAKWIAFLLTSSSVIFSDAAESVVHIIAVWFAWYAIRVTERPPDEDHHYGHDKIGFVSAGVEGGLICIAAMVIILSAVDKLLHGVTLEHVGTGTAITAGAGIVNAFLGFYLVRIGKRRGSLVVEANGQHVLTDAWTSAGAVGGLLLASWTNVLWIDPLMAIIFGGNIVREGVRLVASSVKQLP
ncbi:MAG: cation diffusion facilitator family transporter [Candidatus Kapabacteria bacterium]|nr:cation diffusion facilitator family transporter [Candidatus Kapabacteria bacterium]